MYHSDWIIEGMIFQPGEIPNRRKHDRGMFRRNRLANDEEETRKRRFAGRYFAAKRRDISRQQSLPSYAREPPCRASLGTEARGRIATVEKSSQLVKARLCPSLLIANAYPLVRAHDTLYFYLKCPNHRPPSVSVADCSTGWLIGSPPPSLVPWGPGIVAGEW